MLVGLRAGQARKQIAHDIEAVRRVYRQREPRSKAIENSMFSRCILIRASEYLSKFFTANLIDRARLPLL